MKRRRHRRTQGDVELNLAAMLDMAFQLLAFFILTFRPSPIEGQISLRLPPPVPVTQGKEAVGADVNNTNPVAGVNTLTISIFADPAGGIASLGIGEAGVASLPDLDARLRTIFADAGNPFDQVIVQVADTVRYEALMQVVDVCTHQKLPNGQTLSKLSFVEMPSQ